MRKPEDDGGAFVYISPAPGYAAGSFCSTPPQTPPACKAIAGSAAATMMTP